jgi:periplasmic protein CpxP/Spy
MTKFNRVLLGFIGAYVLVALPLANAQDAGPEGAPKWHAGERTQEIFSQLNLTDEQKKLLEANKEQHRAIMQRARQEMKASREAFQAEMMKPQLDMPQINAIHNQIKILLSQMEDNKLSSILAVRAILTPEQFLKFVNLMHKHKPEHD